MNQNKFDLIVIGSGPGGQRAAVQAAKLGKKVLIVEKEALGGSCLHKGTVPSKTLREKAQQSGSLNIHSAAEALAHAMLVVRKEHNVIRNQLDRNKVECIFGTASFVNPNEIEICDEAQNKKRAIADFVVIATGTRPFQAKPFDFTHPCVFDSDKILEISQHPKKLAVICAGVIGCEYATIFAKLGSNVTLIERRETILRGVDKEIHDGLIKAFDQAQLQLWTQTEIKNVSYDATKVNLETSRGTTSFDAVLVCMGRVGNVEELKLENAGLKANERGIIAVNEQYQTSVPHIFAVGDVQGSPGLATSASEQGRIAAATAFGFNKGRFPSIFPFGIYTIPEISYVGATEMEALQRHKNVVVGMAHFKELARGKILEDESGFLKLIFCKESQKLVGAHCLGTGATELIHVAQVTMCFGGTLEFFLNQIFNYPTLAEAYKVAALNAFNKINQR